MNIVQGEMTIRNIDASDARQLAEWWYEAGDYKRPVNQDDADAQLENIARTIKSDSEGERRRMMIEVCGRPVGYLTYARDSSDPSQAVANARICESSAQSGGYEEQCLNLLEDALFRSFGFDKVTIVDGSGAQVRVASREQWGGAGTKPSGYLELRQEKPEDYHAVEQLTRDAYQADNPYSPVNEHLLVRKLRDSPAYVPELHYLAESDGHIIGHIMYSRARIVRRSGGETAALTFSPLAVLPGAQGKGVGTTLMNFTLGKAARLGHRGVVILGQPDYFTRAGFHRAAKYDIKMPDGSSFDALMAYPLPDFALSNMDGEFYHDAVFDSLTAMEAAEAAKDFPKVKFSEPLPILILLERLAPAQRKKLEQLNLRDLRDLTRISERELAESAKISRQAVETIRKVMREHGLGWGESYAIKEAEKEAAAKKRAASA